MPTAAHPSEHPVSMGTRPNKKSEQLLELLKIRDIFHEGDHVEATRVQLNGEWAEPKDFWIDKDPELVRKSGKSWLVMRASNLKGTQYMFILHESECGDPKLQPLWQRSHSGRSYWFHPGDPDYYAIQPIGPMQDPSETPNKQW